MVGQTLGRINALLPGPPTTITVSDSSSPIGSQIIPQTGTDGYTNEGTGAITVWFRQTSQASLTRILQLWLARTLSHEVDHNVRILAGPGFGTTLLAEIISEGHLLRVRRGRFPGTGRPVAVRPARHTPLDRIHDRV